MDVLILRLIHVVAGAFWVGAVFTNVLFLQPTASALGPDGGRFQFQLLRHRRFATAILVTASLTVLAGLTLLGLATDGFDPARAFAASQLGFTIGGIAGVATFALGSLYVYPRTRRIVRVMEPMLAKGRPPTPEEQAALARLRAELLQAGWATVVGLAITVAAMATARYWSVLL